MNRAAQAVATGSYTQLAIDCGSIGVEWQHPVATARRSVLSGDVACTCRSNFLHGLSFDTVSVVGGSFRSFLLRLGSIDIL